MANRDDRLVRMGIRVITFELMIGLYVRLLIGGAASQNQ